MCLQGNTCQIPSKTETPEKIIVIIIAIIIIKNKQAQGEKF